MKRLSRTTTALIGVAIAIVIVLGYFGIARYRATHRVPAEFSTARAAGGNDAQQITDLSKQVRDDLNQLQDLQHKGQYKEAQKLLTDIETKNATLKTVSLDLATQLATMAQSVSGISNKDVQALALDALNVHLKMISQVVEYNAHLGELTGLLSAKLQYHMASQQRIDELVKQINTDVDAVNGLNTQATEKLKAFDDAIRAAK